MWSPAITTKFDLIYIYIKLFADNVCNVFRKGIFTIKVAARQIDTVVFAIIKEGTLSPTNSIVSWQRTCPLCLVKQK